MEKNLKQQKVMHYLFLVMGIGMFIFTLGFMTDYSDLFGLKLEANQPIAIFYGVMMQMFNKIAFVMAIITIFGFVCMTGLEMTKKIPDKFALIVAGVFFLIAIATSIWAITQLFALQEVYMHLDFTSFSKEGGTEHVIQTRIFSLGMVFYGLQMIYCMAYMKVLVSNHKTFIKIYGEATA